MGQQPEGLSAVSFRVKGVSMAVINATHTVSALALLAALFLPAAAQPPNAPPVSVPGTPGIYVSGQKLAEQMQASIASPADPAVAEVGVTDQYAIHEVHRQKAGPAAIHPGWTEMYLILEGGGVLVTGGKMAVAAGGGNTIEGGVSHTLKKGDVFIIPANTPHMYKQVDGSVSYLEVRFVTAPPGGATK
jgi:mannose-6-phosphate isomerase-like protein (cupin superfamily)